MNYRGFIIAPDAISPTMYTVATEGRGGKIPNVLQGRFTAVSWVKDLVDNYLDAQEEKKIVRKTPTAE